MTREVDYAILMGVWIEMCRLLEDDVDVREKVGVGDKVTFTWGLLTKRQWIKRQPTTWNNLRVNKSEIDTK